MAPTAQPPPSPRIPQDSSQDPCKIPRRCDHVSRLGTFRETLPPLLRAPQVSLSFPIFSDTKKPPSNFLPGRPKTQTQPEELPTTPLGAESRLAHTHSTQGIPDFLESLGGRGLPHLTCRTVGPPDPGGSPQKTVLPKPAPLGDTQKPPDGRGPSRHAHLAQKPPSPLGTRRWTTPRGRGRTYLARGHLLPLGDLEQEPVVLQLQRSDSVDVVRQAVIELAQLLFLLQPRQACGRQWRGGSAHTAGQRRGHGDGGGGGGGGGGSGGGSGPGRLRRAAAARRAHSIRAADKDGARRPLPPTQSGLGSVVQRSASRGMPGAVVLAELAEGKLQLHFPGCY